MHTDIFTYFTKTTGLTELLYSAETWVQVTLELETAGPVAIGTRQGLAPVLSGRGVLLTTGEDEKWILPRGDRLFVISESINRVKVSIQPIAYGEKFDLIAQIRDGINGTIRAIAGLRKKTPDKIAPAEPPCPPALAPPPFWRK